MITRTTYFKAMRAAGYPLKEAIRRAKEYMRLQHKFYRGNKNG